MSLDVDLIGEEKEVECVCECGHKHTKTESEYLYEANITHNLGEMAEAAGIYEAIWRPHRIRKDYDHSFDSTEKEYIFENAQTIKAKEIIPHLKKGLKKLLNNPTMFRRVNPENKWGNYEGLVKFVEDYLAHCESHPEATVKVWR